MRIATIDIGTNTVLLLVGEAITPPSITILADVHAIARLGEGVDKTKRISAQAQERFEAILAEHLNTISSLHIDRIIPFGTSALRDAENREEIIRDVIKKHGVTIELLSGEDESQWTFRGALLGIDLHDHQQIGTIDIGGGSTEISTGTATQFHAGKSFDIGAVRLTERYFQDGITAKAVDEATQLIRNDLNTLPDELRLISTLIAVAGTPTSLAAMDQQLASFSHEKVHGYHLSFASIEQMFDEMTRLDPVSLCEHYPSINRARADILPAGTLILLEAMKFFGLKETIVSTKGLRYGILLREFERVFGPRTDWVTTPR